MTIHDLIALAVFGFGFVGLFLLGLAGYFGWGIVVFFAMFVCACWVIDDEMDRF